MQSNRHRGNNAFTLIELLVVIAIIAILAAILFPVFAQAREKARAATCLSNLKQIGLATMQYVQDYDEAYPPYQEAGALGTSGAWRYLIYPYLKSTQVFQCPDTPGTNLAPQVFYGINFPNYHDNYAINSYIFANDLAATLPPLVLMSRIGSPASLVMVMDSSQAYVDGTTTQTYEAIDANWTTNPAPTSANPSLVRHTDGVGDNIAFADGHAKFYTQGQMDHTPDRYPTNPSTTDCVHNTWFCWGVAYYLTDDRVK